MKIAKQVATPILVRDGDTISASVSHQVRIDGQECWVKYAVDHTVTFNDDTNSIENQLIEHVSSQVVALAEQAAAKVMDRNQ